MTRRQANRASSARPVERPFSFSRSSHRVSRPLLCSTVTGATTDALRAARDAARGADLVEVRLDTASRPRRGGCGGGASLPGARHLPGRLGRRARSRGVRRARERLLTARDRRRRRVRRRRVRGGVPRPPHRAGAVTRVSCRPTTSAGVPADLFERFAAMRATRCRHRQGGGDDPAAQRPVAAVRDRGPAGQPAGRHVLHRRWARRASRRACCPPGSATRGRTRATPWRPGRFPRHACWRSSVSTGARRARRSTGSWGSPSPTRCRPSSTTRPSRTWGWTRSTCRWRRRTSTTSSPSPGRIGLAGASVTAPFKRDALAAATRVDATVARRVGAANTVRLRERRAVGSHQHRRGRIPRAARRGGAGRHARRRARAPAARPARCSRALASRGARSSRVGAASRSRAGARGPVGRRRRASIHPRPARGTCWSTRRPWARGPTSTHRRSRRFGRGARWCTTSSTTRRETALMRAAAAARRRGDRRPRHARRAGGATVRVVDGPCPVPGRDAAGGRARSPWFARPTHSVPETMTCR